jgi:2-methylisocitrate lyase-like PEP mutase family enzyme
VSRQASVDPVAKIDLWSVVGKVREFHAHEQAVDRRGPANPIIDAEEHVQKIKAAVEARG